MVLTWILVGAFVLLPWAIANLAAVCPAHHRLMVPHGLLALVGNPNLPDGLVLVSASRGPPQVVKT